MLIVYLFVKNNFLLYCLAESTAVQVKKKKPLKDRIAERESKHLRDLEEKQKQVRIAEWNRLLVIFESYIAAQQVPKSKVPLLTALVDTLSEDWKMSVLKIRSSGSMEFAAVKKKSGDESTRKWTSTRKYFCSVDKSTNSFKITSC